MTRRRAFLDKKEATRFRLLPANAAASHVPHGGSNERFVPSQEHLDEQHKYGVFFDDDYDYTKHLKSREEKMEMQRVDEEEERVVVRAPQPAFFPPPSALFGDLGTVQAPRKTKEPVLDEEVEHCLDSSDVEGCDQLEDNFIELAGGAVDGAFAFRVAEDFSDEDDDDDDEQGPDFSRGARYEYSGHSEDLGFSDDEDDVRSTVIREGDQRDIDEVFDRVLDAYDDQLGELDAEDSGMAGFLEPNEPRIKKMLGAKRSNPDYDEQAAKEYVRQRMRIMEEQGEEKEKMEVVEVDDGVRKRMKWDCESFATQYTNIFNHPTMIKEAPGRLSRKALKKLDRLDAKDNEEEDEEMDDGESMISTVSTIRPKGETAEERRQRKAGVKEAQRMRRQEKKMNREAFASEERRVNLANTGKLKAKPIL